MGIIQIGPHYKLELEISSFDNSLPVVVLLNGSAMNLRQWDKIIKVGFSQLFKGFRILRYNYGGIGRSTKPTTGWNLWDLAEELRLVLDKLEIQKAHIYGWSKGTIVGQAFAAKYPERLHTLAGYGWYHFQSDTGDTTTRYFQRRLKSFESLRDIWQVPMNKPEFERLWSDVYRQIIFGKTAAKMGLLDCIYEYFLKPKLFKLLHPTPISSIYDWFYYATHEMLALGPEINSNLLKLSHLPILIQHAQQDEVLPVNMAREIHQLIPHSRLIEYPAPYSHVSIGLKSAHARTVMTDYLSFLGSK